MAAEERDDSIQEVTEPFRVVIVDDQRLVRDGIRLILEQGNDFEILRECSDGDEVASALREVDADVVLMDMRMKRVGGAEAIARMRAHD